MPPTFGNGKICYIQIPATDIARSADFYHRVFGWDIREREHRTAFDDGVGQVSGEWVLDRPLATTPGMLVYIMVDSVAATVEAILANGGEIVQAVGGDAPEITARFRDPGGNVIGVYQEPVTRPCLYSQARLGVPNFPATSISWLFFRPFRACLFSTFPPTACAVGCTLPPLRG